MNLKEKGFFKVILCFKSTDIYGFSQNHIKKIEFNDSVRLIIDQETEFARLYSTLYEDHNLEMKNFEECIYYYFEIDSEPTFDFNEINSLHSVLLVSLLISSKDIIKNILVVHTADNNRRWISVDHEFIIPNKIESQFFKLMDGFDDSFHKMSLDKVEIKNSTNTFPIVEKIFLSESYSNLKNALLYFLNSSKSRLFEEMIINLSVVLESLFSPSGQNELSHQNAFNISKFMENKPEESIEIYEQIKKFYGIRSKIVHGLREKDTKSIAISAIKTYKILQKALSKILSDEELKEKFEDNALRGRYLKDVSFGIN